MEKVTLKVDGMSCEHCAKAVTEAVSGITGVSDVSVDLKNGMAAFNYDPIKAQLETIKAAIVEEGFTVQG